MKLKLLSRLLLLVVASLLVATIFKAIWRIELQAPQYPEGLVLLIYADKLGGDVDIINGLNHYIGMQTLHTENFIEFRLLTYIIGFFALFAILVALVNNKRMLVILFVAFVSFGIIAMVDFYRWNYNYGHNLNPHAAIVVPGMAYQPPLIGYKKLLNFGAYSIPDTGGWMFISAGMFLLLAVIMESKKWKDKKGVSKMAMVLIGIMFSFSSCNSRIPKQAKINSDNCDFCKMTIVDDKFVAEYITSKGRYYFFDDISCMVKFKKQNTNAQNSDYYIADFNNPSHFISLNDAILLKSEKIASPMGGNIAAFSKQEEANKFTTQYMGTAVLWAEMIK